MSDLDFLQGRWRIASLEMNGAAMPAAMLAPARVVIEGTKFSSLGMGAAYEGEMSLVETASPKTIAIRFSAGPEGGAVNHGAYERVGEGWRLCLNISGGPAPSAFATAPGDNLALETLVREG